MKRVIYFLLSVLVILGLHLTIRYTINEIYISKYEDGEYNSGMLKVLKIINYPEPYVVYYNEGNNYYQNKEYEKAVEKYKKALTTVTKKRVCDVRTNLSLARLELIEYENNDNLRNDLVEVEEILLEDKCATEDDNGKDKSAQKLYNKIEELLKSKADPKDPDKKKDDDKKDDDNKDKKDEKDIEEKIREQQKKSSEERQKITNNDPYEWYDGKTW